MCGVSSLKRDCKLIIIKIKDNNNIATLKNNKKLMKAAKTDGRQIFEKNIFPQLFNDAAQEAYIESTETYTKLFEDAGKYRAMMS